MIELIQQQKRKIVKIVCSNFSYDGENLVIEPNIAFKAVIKNSLNMKKLPRFSWILTTRKLRTPLLKLRFTRFVSFLEQTGSQRAKALFRPSQNPLERSVLIAPWHKKRARRLF